MPQHLLLPITKSHYLTYRECPETFWYLHNNPEVLTPEVISDFDQQLIDNGAEVERWAAKLFVNPLWIEAHGDEAIQATERARKNQTPTIIQATIATEDMLVRVDVLHRTPEGDYQLYEVKASSNDGKEPSGKKTTQHLYDAAFQSAVAKRAGITVTDCFLIELNKAFRKHGEIDPRELLTVTNITEKVQEIAQEVEEDMETMKQLRAQQTPPPPCDCVYSKSRKNFCRGFAHMHPEVPEYSIHDLAKIGNSKKKLQTLIEDHVYTIQEIPVDFKLPTKLANQVQVAQTGIPIIDHKEIQQRLDELVYPLYFLDYETYPAAIPVYDGCRPYQQVPFQFSLHIQKSPGSPLEHKEYLHTDPITHPMRGLGEALCEAIGPTGSVIVWNQTFEMGCNRDLAELLPDHADRFLNINDRVFDLMKLFHDHCYLHPAMKGSYSIKYVLPVLAPELSYADLGVRDGAMAMHAWKRMMFADCTSEETQQIIQDLLEYCTLDTFAMVRILEELQKLDTL